jgi:hypothetical protein
MLLWYIGAPAWYIGAWNACVDVPPAPPGGALNLMPSVPTAAVTFSMGEGAALMVASLVDRISVDSIPPDPVSLDSGPVLDPTPVPCKSASKNPISRPPAQSEQLEVVVVEALSKTFDSIENTLLSVVPACVVQYTSQPILIYEAISNSTAHEVCHDCTNW